MGNEDPAHTDKAVVDVVEDVATHHRRDAAAEFLNKVPEGRVVSHAKKRVAMGKSAVILDTSLDSAEEAERRQAAADAAAAPGDSIADRAAANTAGDKAFDNATDLENEDFVFCY
ncbi:hypothetical protein PG990_000589 [Apiospora arundinis]